MGLLAVDLGLRIGLAYFDRRGVLGWYRSRHIGPRSKMKTAFRAIARDAKSWGLEAIAVEGDMQLAEPWRRFALDHGLIFHHIAAETWRPLFLLEREQRGTKRAKAAALRLARQIIEKSGARRPTSLNDDAAEAIVIGAWAVVEMGWRAQREIL